MLDACRHGAGLRRAPPSADPTPFCPGALSRSDAAPRAREVRPAVDGRCGRWPACTRESRSGHSPPFGQGAPILPRSDSRLLAPSPRAESPGRSAGMTKRFQPAPPESRERRRGAAARGGRQRTRGSVRLGAGADSGRQAAAVSPCIICAVRSYPSREPTGRGSPRPAGSSCGEAPQTHSRTVVTLAMTPGCSIRRW